VSDQKADVILKCTANPTTGELSDCTEAASGLKKPVGIAIYHDYLYLGDEGNNAIIKCSVNNLTGDLSDCAETGTGFKQTNGIYIY
jgi:hypothetical protein